MSAAIAAARVAALLADAPLFADLDAPTREDLAARGERVRYRKGDRIVSELEPGADVFVLLSGDAEVAVEGRGGEREVLGQLGPGATVGEMSSLTGELRSATVTATSDVEALRLPDAAFDRLRERRPAIAIALLRTLSRRLADAEAALDQRLGAPVSRAPAPAPKRPRTGRGALRRAWSELVVGRRRDCAFLALAGFVATLVAVRLGVHLAFRFDVAPRLVLRTAYITGFALIGLSAGASLLVFRPDVRRAVALAYGVGLALIANELGVTLAFDIFFKDIHTADPNVPFDLERLYRRTEPLRATAIALAVLVQAAYLRRFYAHAWFVVRTRARRMIAGRG
jgi:CRP-like cAMP-binding protein